MASDRRSASAFDLPIAINCKLELGTSVQGYFRVRVQDLGITSIAENMQNKKVKEKLSTKLMGQC